MGDNDVNLDQPARNYVEEIDDIAHEQRIRDLRLRTRALIIAEIAAGRLYNDALEEYEMRNGMRPCTHRNVDILTNLDAGRKRVQCVLCSKEWTT